MRETSHLTADRRLIGQEAQHKYDQCETVALDTSEVTNEHDKNQFCLPVAFPRWEV